ncbi:GntR family transcriptional regulator [Arthrobacter sp. V4I6]|uniref:GntR family transcriptional regulator n=1 Tax=unclassified Arthrobacter TaxID=235627 RepID=UPI002786997D|nr:MULTISPECIES: GntR family transcriptional regulator [unclassified Arthrobacter]MDQ0822487.1 GntR family transcriptional regulator [Arthrobacter sp. V1I7]MDQ0852114.1 GntR family transcriptional regulator [Arthrobacter sp. V4I6]
MSVQPAGTEPRERANGLNREEGPPLHAQIRDILHRQILERPLLPGSPLPTEEELQKQFGVSRSVVRQALSGLSDLGLIRRQRGRGSVVAATPVLRRHIQRAGGLDEQAAAHGQRLRTHVIAVEHAPPPESAVEALNTTNTWKIERIRYLEEVPVAFMRTWVPRDLFPHFAKELLENASLLGLMREHGYHPAGGPRQVQAVAADHDLAQILNSNIREPLLLLQGVTRDALGHGLEWFNVWHSPNTVFDVDAQVTSQPGRVSEEHIRRLRNLTQQLESELADLERGAR